MRRVFLITAIVGAILPLSFFIPFLVVHGLDVSLFFRQLFQNNISAFFAMDVLVSSVVLWWFVYLEGRRCGMKKLWAYTLCNMLVGVSLALPLFLFFRQRKLDANESGGSGEEVSTVTR